MYQIKMLSGKCIKTDTDRKNNKNKYVVCCKVSKAKLVLNIKAQR